MTQPNQPVEEKKVELPPAEITLSDAQRAEELMSTTYSGVMTIVAESFYYKRQLLSALHEMQTLKRDRKWKETIQSLLFALGMKEEMQSSWKGDLNGWGAAFEWIKYHVKRSQAESRLSQLSPQEPIQSFDEWWSANVHLMAVGSESWAKATARAAWNARGSQLNQSESSRLAEKERR